MARTVTRRARIMRLALGSASLVAGSIFATSAIISPAAAGSAPDKVSEASRDGHHDPAQITSIRRSDRARAQLATAAFQDVEIAEAAGWKSSLHTLGCFQDQKRGGMGVHYINDSLLDATVDMTKPEALVYELDAKGAVTGLVAHEYVVPVDVWTKKSPPRLFGVAFHRHPTLPLYVLHAWLWKDNANGDVNDWNPGVRQCPAGVPIFGKDLPAP